MKVKAIDGLPIFDAKKQLRFTVTKNDVTRADPLHSESCAAARAALRDCHAQEVRVHLGRVYVRQNKSNWQRYQTPKNLRSEIIAFDRGGSFEPGEFVLEPLKHYKKPTGKRQGSQSRDRTGKRRASPTVLKNVRTGPA